MTHRDVELVSSHCTAPHSPVDIHHCLACGFDHHLGRCNGDHGAARLCPGHA